jgi:phosphoribosylformylglycinamidine synthase
MEACIDLAQNHRDWFVGIQDLGAAGLTSSAIETAAKGGVGIEIDVALVPRREEGMTPYEVMLSESQERMLIIAKAGHEQDVIDLFRRWELESTVIGRVTEGRSVRILERGAEVARVPVRELTEPPLYRREGIRPVALDELQSYDFTILPDLADMPPTILGQTTAPRTGASRAETALLLLLAQPNIASKHWIYRQYDHQVLTNTVIKPGADAAVLRVKGTSRAIALSTDGNGRYCYLDPRAGGAIAVAEAARNVVCAGGQPVAATNCLNFGNPENLEVYYQLEESIKGMAEACQALGTPVVSGNVSLYNESGGSPIYPTPVVGVLGVLEEVGYARSSEFPGAGLDVYLLGDSELDPAGGRAGSEYLVAVHGFAAGRPFIDLDREAAVQTACLEGIRAGVVRSAHDCADGGLAVALAESALQSGCGLDASGWQPAGRLDSALFGEAQSRILVTIEAGDASKLEDLGRRLRVPLLRIGITTEDARFRLGEEIDLAVDELRRVYEEALPSLLAG